MTVTEINRLSEDLVTILDVVRVVMDIPVVVGGVGVVSGLIGNLMIVGCLIDVSD